MLHAREPQTVCSCGRRNLAVLQTYPQIEKKVEAKVMIGVGSLLVRRLPAHVKKKLLFGLYIIRVLLVSAAFFFFFSLIEQVALYDLGN